MRELATREYVPTLAYAAGVLLLGQFLVTVLLREYVAAAGIHLLFVPVLVLLVMGVDAPPWARLSGYAWAGLALLGDLMVLGAAAFGGTLGPGLTLGALALVPGAAWILGASLVDEGAGRALGAAAAAGLLLSAILALSQDLLLVGSWDLGRIVSQLALALSIAWFVVLGRDLQQGRRHGRRHFDEGHASRHP